MQHVQSMFRAAFVVLFAGIAFCLIGCTSGKQAVPAVSASTISLQRACDSGDAKDCNELGYAYVNGEGWTAESSQLYWIREIGCIGDASLGCFILHRNSEFLEKDFVKAAPFFRKSCEGGNISGCYNLGHLYANGRGMEKDVAKSAQLLEKACEGGLVLGCHDLGSMYATGEGVVKNTSKAARFFAKTCLSDFYLGCQNLGSLLARGEGVETTVQILSESCDNDVASSCNLLGRMFDEGIGVRQDSAKAAQLHAKACEKSPVAECRNSRE